MPPITSAQILSTSVNSAGQTITFPQSRGEVNVAILVIAPGATLPVHKHPFPRMGYVLSGTLQVTNIETKATSLYAAGDFALESVGQWHIGENVGRVPLKLLVIDLVEAGAENTTLPSRDSNEADHAASATGQLLQTDHQT